MSGSHLHSREWNPEEPMYCIWSHEHRAWWAPKRQGYTPNHKTAGRYTMEEAAEIVLDHIPPGEEVATKAEWASRFQAQFEYDCDKLGGRIGEDEEEESEGVWSPW